MFVIFYSFIRCSPGRVVCSNRISPPTRRKRTGVISLERRRLLSFSGSLSSLRQPPPPSPPPVTSSSRCVLYCQTIVNSFFKIKFQRNPKLFVAMYRTPTVCVNFMSSPGSNLGSSIYISFRLVTNSGIFPSKLAKHVEV